jgi:LPXTG-motif cell wall-anchored protein
VPPTTDPTIPTTDPTIPTTDPTIPTTDPTIPTTDPTIPTTDPTVQPNTPTTPDRCASSRGTKPQCGGDPVDEVVPETPTVPVVDPVTTVAGGGERGSPAPVQDVVLAGELERAAPAPVVDPMPAASLPRTGAGIGDQVTLAAGLLFAGLALLRVFRRRRPSAQAA